MNKKISKFVSCVLAVTLFMSLLTVTAFAAESNYDLNGDGKVSISDVTALQLRLSGNRSNWTDAYEKRADINGDGKININDVTSLEKDSNHSLVDQVMEDSKFLADPMPNLVFTRDPFASIGNGISLNKMYSVTRNRETIYAEYIFEYHKDYKGTKKYYDRYNEYCCDICGVKIDNRFDGLYLKTKFLLQISLCGISKALLL